MMNIILFPFKIILLLLEFVLNLTGRIVCAVIGLVFMALGLILMLTIIGAFIGIPLLVLGILLLLRACFR